MPSTKYTVGDRVLIFSVNRPGDDPHEGIVVKVGRTRVTVDRVGGGFRWQTPDQFRMDTGMEIGDFPQLRIMTPEAYAESQRVAELRDQLRGLGVVVVRPGGYADVKLSADALAEILDVVVRDRKANPS